MPTHYLGVRFLYIRTMGKRLMDMMVLRWSVCWSCNVSQLHWSRLEVQIVLQLSFHGRCHCSCWRVPRHDISAAVQCFPATGSSLLPTAFGSSSLPCSPLWLATMISTLPKVSLHIMSSYRRKSLKTHSILWMFIKYLYFVLTTEIKIHRWYRNRVIKKLGVAFARFACQPPIANSCIFVSLRPQIDAIVTLLH